MPGPQPHSGISGSGTANTLAKFTGAGTVGNSLITETSGRDNVPVLSGGDYNADFFSSAQTGYELSDAPSEPGFAYTPNGLLAQVTESNAAAGVAGANIGVYDTRPAGDFSTISALALDCIKAGNANIEAMNGMSLYVWNQGDSTIGSGGVFGISVSLESDDGSIAGDVRSINVGAPAVSGAAITGKVVGIQINDQTATATGGAYAFYYNAPAGKTFAVKANGDVEIKGNVGFYGTAPAARPNVPAALPTVQDVINALLALGLVTQS